MCSHWKFLLAFALGVACATAAGPWSPPHRTRAPVTDPDSIEVYRAGAAGVPEVGDTIRITGPLTDDRRDQWTVHLRYGDRVVHLKGVGLNRPAARD